MKRTIGVFLGSLAICFALAAATLPVPAQASTVSAHKSHHHKIHIKSKKSKKSKGSERIRSAQRWLKVLGYDPGPADGAMGHRTVNAIKAFQRDHDRLPNGKLTDKIYRLLKEEAAATHTAEIEAKSPQDFYAMHPDFYGYTGQNYSNPNALTTQQPMPTRYGDLEVSEAQNGPTRAYMVTMNSNPVYQIEGQPSSINLSRTFSIDDTDAVVVTSYSPGDTVCPYRHSLLVIRAQSSGAHTIDNCSRDYQAYTQDDSLYISFPGAHTDGWSSGAMWRYENGTLTRL